MKFDLCCKFVVFYFSRFFNWRDLLICEVGWELSEFLWKLCEGVVEFEGGRVVE